MIDFINRIFSSKFIRVSILLAICFSICLSISTYSEYDVSLNTASDSVTENILGSFGAYLGDFLLTFFGYSALVIAFSALCLAINIIRENGVRYIKLRFLSSVISAFLFGAILSLNFKDYSSFQRIIFVEYYGFGIELKIIFLALILFLAISFFFLSLGFHFREYLYLLSKISIPSFAKKSDQIQKTMQIQVRDKSLKKSSKSKDENLEDQSDKRQISFFEKAKNDDSEFELPDLDLLNNTKSKPINFESDEELSKKAEELLEVLNDFGVKGNIIEINQGPVVTQFEFEPAAGTKSSRVISLADDIARTLCAVSARIAVIPGRNVLGIELPNNTREFFKLRELLETENYNDKAIQLPIVLGKDIAGKPCIVDLAKMPHLLVAGTTGSGKSVAINTMIMSLLYRHSPKECRFIMIDPKMLELSVYDGIPHLLSPVVTEPGKAVVALKWAVREMENRYRLMSNVGVRNIHGYNSKILDAISKGEELKRTVQTGFDPETGKPVFESVPIEMETIPFIVIIVDEMADLMLVAGKDIESSIQRLAQMARAAGIHLIMATQRPSVDVITGVIKANFPSRISFKVTSKIDSRTILGEQGSEQLLGMGDMLYMGSSSRILRVHGPFVDDLEVERVSSFLKSQGVPEYIEAVTSSDDEIKDDMDFEAGDDSSDDGLYKQAVQIVRRDKKSSTSYIQRSLRIGYNRAALIVERMEKEGILSEPNSSGKREILIDTD